MSTFEELKKRALDDLIHDEEQRVQRLIKEKIQGVMNEQRKMADAAKRISEYQAELKAIKLDEIKIEL